MWLFNPNQSLKQPSSVVIYSLVIRSFSHRFPFRKGKNEGNISENDKTKNDTTSSPEGAQRNVGDKYAKLSELWSKLAKGGVIHRRIKRNFRAKRQASHWIVAMMKVESWELRTIQVRQQFSIFNFQLSTFFNGQRWRKKGWNLPYFSTDKDNTKRKRMTDGGKRIRMRRYKSNT